ncbi:MAG: hypothetical protein HYZ49_00795 [Chloroflexi bacterium]|nr:hypothetical protein [Chloroflexota bacterium]
MVKFLRSVALVSLLIASVGWFDPSTVQADTSETISRFANSQNSPVSCAVINKPNPALSTPQLITPNQLYPPPILRPLFDWGNVSGALSYTLQVSISRSFAFCEVSMNMASSAHTLTNDLPRNATIFWRVRANNSSGSSPWSRVGHFDSPNPPSVPMLTSPTNGAPMLTGPMPILDWSDSNSAPAYYEVTISTNPQFSSVLGRRQGGRTPFSTYTVETPLTRGAIYYWRVRAYNTAGQYSESEIRNFIMPGGGLAYDHLYEVMDAYGNGSTNRLLESYRGTNDADTAWVYDNALAMIAFMARGTSEDWERAKVIADSFIEAQNNDPVFNDGRLRDAYCASHLMNPDGKACIPVPYIVPSLDSNTGNMAWAMLALLDYYEIQGGTTYLTAAQSLGEWIYDNTCNTGVCDGYTGGYFFDEGTNSYKKLEWKGTEHNIDVYVAFMKLYEATGNADWRTRAMYAKNFVQSMWNPTILLAHFWTGTLNNGSVNGSPIPEDAQTWGLMALGEISKYGTGITWVENNLEVSSCPGCPTCTGFLFSFMRSDDPRYKDPNYRPRGCWWEGTAHMIIAFQMKNETAKASDFLEVLRKVQVVVPNNNNKGIVSACLGGAVTGYGWTSPNTLHIGATAWYIFAERSYNPFWDIGTGDPIPYEGIYN